MSTFVYTNQIHIPRTGTLLYGRKIGMRTFLLIAYFFIAMNMTHSQLIHEVDLTCPEEEDGKYQLSGGAKTSCNTTVHFHKIFRYSSHGMQCFAFSTICICMAYCKGLFHIQGKPCLCRPQIWERRRYQS